MSEISVSDARAELPTVISRAKKRPIRLMRHGQPVAVLVHPDLFDKAMEAMEELEDIAAFDEAIQKNEKTIPWEQVKRELGLA